MVGTTSGGERGNGGREGGREDGGKGEGQRGRGVSTAMFIFPQCSLLPVVIATIY